jgi:Mg2+-importing ATPase
MESVLSASMVVLVLRTRLPFFRSLPSRIMLLATLGVGIFTVILPYTPLAGPLEFVPLPASYVLIVFAIVGLYVVAAEITKRVFYQWNDRHGS